MREYHQIGANHHSDGRREENDVTHLDERNTGATGRGDEFREQAPLEEVEEVGSIIRDRADVELVGVEKTPSAVG